MALYPRGKKGIYWYDFTVAGIRHRGSTETNKLATARLIESRRMNEAINSGGELPKKAPRLSEFKPRFFEWVRKSTGSGHLKTRTLRYYQNGWKMIERTGLPNLPLTAITRELVMTVPFAGQPPTVNQAIRTLRRMLGLAEEWKFLPRAPKLKLLEEQGRELTIDAAMETKLLAHSGRKLRDVIIIVQDTGLRPDEVFRIRVENIFWDRMEIFNPYGKRKKSRRWVPISRRMLDLLMLRVAKLGTKGKGRKKTVTEVKEGWLFPSPKSKSGHITTVAKAFRRARTNAGLPKELVLYSARHTFGTTLMAQTGDPALVQDAMGHDDFRSTRRYLHPDLNRVRGIINQRNETKEAVQ